MTLRIGIVGAGYIGNVHATILSQDERVRVASVYDISTERAAKLASATGANVAQSAEGLFDQVDAVYITTPNTKHVELALAALSRDLHTFCEKPMATSLEEARRILNACQRAKSVFQVGHNRRFAPVYKQVRKLIADGTVKPTSAHIKMNRGELQNPTWVSSLAVTGGFLYETTIHLFDMARWLFGEISNLYCVASSNCYAERDDFTLALSFVNGMHATFASSAHASWFFPFERIEIFGDHATIETQEMERISCVAGLHSEIVTQDFFQLTKEKKWGYQEEDTLFVDAILEGKSPAVSALDGYKAVEIVDACYRSSEAKRAVQLEENKKIGK